jgi:hypothetical protein
LSTLPDTLPRAPGSPGCFPGPALQDAFGPLLRIDRRDAAGLTWTKRRARMWLTALKRRRKYQVDRGAPYTPQEGALIEALAGLEREAGRLLDLITTQEPPCPTMKAAN